MRSPFKRSPFFQVQNEHLKKAGNLRHVFTKSHPPSRQMKRFFTFQNPEKSRKKSIPIEHSFAPPVRVRKVGIHFFVWKAAKPRRSQDFFRPGRWWWCLFSVNFDGMEKGVLKKKEVFCEDVWNMSKRSTCIVGEMISWYITAMMYWWIFLRVGSRWSKALM